MLLGAATKQYLWKRGLTGWQKVIGSSNLTYLQEQVELMLKLDPQTEYRVSRIRPLDTKKAGIYECRRLD